MAHCLQCRERDRWSVSGGIQDEGKIADSPNQLTVTMFYIIVKQLLEMQIPRAAHAKELETNFVEPNFSFRIHFATFKDWTLIADPLAQFRVFLVPEWHIACNAGERQVEC
jgi:hypothetical protein